jgi:1,4-dihydroxy-2-naphthoate octaprenyltransferase
MKSENQILPASPSALKAFFLASRPKTWIASLSPVFIGATIAPDVHLTLFFLTALFSLLVQIGTNFANDYFDYRSGVDAHRNGPKRATQEGWVQPQSMLTATALTFSLALLVATPLIALAGLWSLLLALLCIALGILYTGGPKPLGYIGLGEFLAFLFFGPIATCGAYYLQMGHVFPAVLVASIAPGLFSTALLTVNNLRDEHSDRQARKKTLIVRFGRTFGLWEYALCLLFAALIPPALVLFYNAPLRLLLLPAIFLFAIPTLRKPSLPTTALLFFLYTLAFCTLLLC